MCNVHYMAPYIFRTLLAHLQLDYQQQALGKRKNDGKAPWAPNRTAPNHPPPLLGACATADASVAASFIDWPNLRAYSSSALFYLTRPTQPNPTPRLNCAIRSMYIYNLYPPPHIPMVSLSFQRPFLSTRENYTPKEFLRGLFLLRKRLSK